MSIDNQEYTQGKEGANQKDLLLTPINATYEDVVEALNDRNNYGSYLVNVRDKASVAKAIEDYFGPTLPTRKKPLEKLRGKPFPPKTKQNMDEFLKNLEFGNPGILTWEVQNDGTLLFLTDKNESKIKTKNVLKQVLGSVGIKYKLEDYENLKKFSTSINEIKRLQRLAGLSK